MEEGTTKIRIGDLVKWKFWMSEVFEGPQPVGIVVNILYEFSPNVCEVLYTTGRKHHESIEALELVVPKDEEETI